MNIETSPDQLFIIFGLLTFYVFALAVWSYYFFRDKYKTS